jgi:tetratricopeptide (TPR) repeat protein
MMRAMRRTLSLLVATAFWSPLGPVAYADEQVRPPLAPLDDERTAHAEAQFRGAVEAFAAGRYHAAIVLFTEADRIQPRPELSFDIARSYENLGDYKTAVGFYREYLRRAGHPADEAEVLARIDQLSSRNSSPAPLPESNDEGPKMIAAQTASGPYAGGSNGVNGTARDAAQASGSGKVFTTLGWAGLGAAAVAFGGAAAFEIMRHNAEKDASNERQQIRFDQYVQTMETDRTTARVLFGTGAVLTVTGGVLLFVGASKSRDEDKKSLVALRVAPEAGGLSAGATWRF